MFPAHDLHERIKEAHRDEMSKRQISIELNCSRTTVYRVISSDKDRRG
ncbi:helix-turn-helix domain-containing protein [Vibrio kagoshimensis]